MLQQLRRFLSEEEGATTVEYAIMVAGIAVLIIAAVFLAGARVGEIFNQARSHR
jgi:Flp pilus assembly pilin Flp